MTSPIEREVLIDILRNTGTTRDQVRYRLSGQSPTTINRAIERLIQNGEVCYISNRLEITRDGLQSLCRQVKGMTGRTHPDWPICRFRVSEGSAKCGYKVRNGYADVICDEDGCLIEEDD